MSRLPKSDWIAWARTTFQPSPRAVCCICTRYASLTHAHHLVPLGWQFDRGAIDPDHRHVWLCPTHHAAIHMFLGDEGEDAQHKGRRSAGVVGDLTNEELNALLNLFGQSRGAR